MSSKRSNPKSTGASSTKKVRQTEGASSVGSALDVITLKEDIANPPECLRLNPMADMDEVFEIFREDAEKEYKSFVDQNENGDEDVEDEDEEEKLKEWFFQSLPFNENLLEGFIHPISVSQFISEYHNKKALAILPNPNKPDHAARFRRMSKLHLFDLSQRSLAENTASDNLFVWMRSLSGGINSFEIEDVEAALKCADSGASLYFRLVLSFIIRAVKCLPASILSSSVSFSSSSVPNYVCFTFFPLELLLNLVMSMSGKMEFLLFS